MKNQQSKTAMASKPQLVYGAIVYWVTIIAAMICVTGPTIAMARIDNNVLNPHHLFAAIWEGKEVDVIWEQAAGGFPGGHFYLEYFLTGDSWIQLGIALGGSAALWGLLAASWFYIKERSYGYSFACILVSGIILFAMLGVIKLK